MMRILHVTWVDPADRAGRGGGMRVYVAALVAAQRGLPGVSVSTLATGLMHDLRPRQPRWQRQREGHFELVNSACLAPSHAAFAAPAQLSDGPTEAAFADFLAQSGPYDIVHFHALEGLPAGVLALRARFPATRFVLSLHNYHAFCPQVNLWQREQANCRDHDQGRACARCLPVTPQPHAVRTVYAIESWLARLGTGPGTRLHRHLWLPLMQAGWRALKRLRRGQTGHARPEGKENALLQGRRGRIVDLINRHCDLVLAVSERTRRLALGFGVASVTTCRIGTDHADCWARSAPRNLPRAISETAPLRLAYLGYMRRDKGFAFLLDALATLPPEHAARLHLTIAARAGPPQMMAQLSVLKPRLAGLVWHDGYTRAGLDQLLTGIHCGIVPPLWEDNLPQVALEMHCRHIPLLTSDLGGAQELGGSAALTFRAGDCGSFHTLIARILSGQVDLRRYWANAQAPRDMSGHAQDMMTFYRGLHESHHPYRDPEIRHLVDSGLSGNELRGAARTEGALRALQPAIRQPVRICHDRA